MGKHELLIALRDRVRRYVIRVHAKADTELDAQMVMDDIASIGHRLYNLGAKDLIADYDKLLGKKHLHIQEKTEAILKLEKEKGDLIKAIEATHKVMGDYLEELIELRKYKESNETRNRFIDDFRGTEQRIINWLGEKNKSLEEQNARLHRDIENLREVNLSNFDAYHRLAAKNTELRNENSHLKRKTNWLKNDRGCGHDSDNKRTEIFCDTDLGVKSSLTISRCLTCNHIHILHFEQENDVDEETDLKAWHEMNSAWSRRAFSQYVKDAMEKWKDIEDSLPDVGKRVYIRYNSGDTKVAILSYGVQGYVFLVDNKIDPKKPPVTHSYPGVVSKWRYADEL